MYTGTINLLQIVVILVSVALLSVAVSSRQTLTYDSLPGKFPSSSPRRSVWGGLLNQGNVGYMSVIFVCVFVLCASFFFSPKGHIWSVVLVLICSCQNGRQTCQNAVAILGDCEDPRVSRWEKESNRVLLHLGKGGFCPQPSESVFLLWWLLDGCFLLS